MFERRGKPCKTGLMRSGICRNVKIGCLIALSDMYQLRVRGNPSGIARDDVWQGDVSEFRDGSFTVMYRVILFL